MKFDLETFSNSLKDAKTHEYNQFTECIWYGRVIQLFALDLISTEAFHNLEYLTKI